MSNVIGGDEHVVRDFTAAREAAELYHGLSAPSNIGRPIVNSYEYMHERAALSAVLVARAVDTIIVKDESEFGYRFCDELPNYTKSCYGFSQWVNELGHRALDRVVETDKEAAVIARRYEALAWPDLALGEAPGPETRRTLIGFKGGVTDIYGWLRVGSVAAKYNGLEISPDQALPFIVDKLPILQQGAKRDVSLQDVRSAILHAIEWLGEMRTPGDPSETTDRFSLLKQYVLEKANHHLVASKFGKLYTVSEDPVMGISFAENPQGFGVIKPKRATPLGCPAAYSMRHPDEVQAPVNTAFFRIIRASLNAMVDLDLLRDAVHTQRQSVESAAIGLRRRLLIAD